MSLSINKTALNVNKVTFISPLGESKPLFHLKVGDTVVWQKSVEELVADLNNGVSYSDADIYSICAGRYGALLKLNAGDAYTLKDATVDALTQDSYVWIEIGEDRVSDWWNFKQETRVLEILYLWQEAPMRYQYFVSQNTVVTKVSPEVFLHMQPSSLGQGMQGVQQLCDNAKALEGEIALPYIDDPTNGNKILGQALFRNAEKVTKIDLSRVGCSVENLMMFAYGCYALQELDMTGITAVSGSGMYMFGRCTVMTTLKFSTIDFSGITTFQLWMWQNAALTTITGTITDFGKSIGSYLTVPCGDCPLSHDSAMVIINGTYDFTGAGSSTSPTLQFKSTTYSTLSADEIAVATNRGWVVTSA